MSHRSIRLLIRDTVKSLRSDIQFTYARTSDFNILNDKKYPFVVLDPLSASPNFAVDGVYNYSQVYTCLMAFYELDKSDQNSENTAKILDETSDLVDQFINKLNFYMTTSDEILISGINKTPAVKVTNDIITGYVVNLTLTVMDDFDYCSVYCVDGDDC